MTCQVIAFTRRGASLGRELARALGGTLWVPARLGGELGEKSFERLEDWVSAWWSRADALVFVGAFGIAVRGISPHVKDKFSDPAVVGVDEAGRFAVPLLSGHVGGANDLACRIAALTGGQAAISTATDVNGLFAVDVWARDHGLGISDRALAKEVSAALLEGETVGFQSDFPLEVPGGLTPGPAELGVWVTARKGPAPFPRCLRLVPKCLILGLGCRRGTAQEAIRAGVEEALGDWDLGAVCQVGSIDLKKDEPGLLAFCESLGAPLVTYSAQELARAEGEFASSDFVRRVTGVDNVCERAAVLSGGKLVIPKQGKNGVTVALAIKERVE